MQTRLHVCNEISINSDQICMRLSNVTKQTSMHARYVNARADSDSLMMTRWLCVDAIYTIWKKLETSQKDLFRRERARLHVQLFTRQQVHARERHGARDVGALKMKVHREKIKLRRAELDNQTLQTQITRHGHVEVFSHGKQ